MTIMSVPSRRDSRFLPGSQLVGGQPSTRAFRRLDGPTARAPPRLFSRLNPAPAAAYCPTIAQPDNVRPVSRAVMQIRHHPRAAPGSGAGPSAAATPPSARCCAQRSSAHQAPGRQNSPFSSWLCLCRSLDACRRHEEKNDGLVRCFARRMDGIAWRPQVSPIVARHVPRPVSGG